MLAWIIPKVSGGIRTLPTHFFPLLRYHPFKLNIWISSIPQCSQSFLSLTKDDYLCSQIMKIKHRWEQANF